MENFDAYNSVTNSSDNTLELNRLTITITNQRRHHGHGKWVNRWRHAKLRVPTAPTVTQQGWSYCYCCVQHVMSPWPRPLKPKQNANRTLPEEASLDRVDNSIATLSQAVRLAAGFSCFHLSRHGDAHSQQRALPLAACSRQGRTVPTLTCVATVDWLIGARALRIAMAPRGKPRAAPARKNVTPLRSGTRASTVNPSAMDNYGTYICLLRDIFHKKWMNK